MSVVKSQRSQSQLEFLRTARNLQIYTVQKCVNTIPKRYTFYIGQRLVEAGKMTLDDVRISFQCWLAYALHFDACGTVKSMVSLVYQLFGKKDGFWILKTNGLKKNSIYRKRKYIARVAVKMYNNM